MVGDVFRFTTGMCIPADSVVLSVDSATDGRIECNEELVTGLLSQKIKGVIDRKMLEKYEEINNILYAKSFIVSGEGKAVVCAVGPRT